MWGVGPSHFLLWASVSTPKWAGVVGALPCPLKPVQGEMLGWTAGPMRRCQGPCSQVHGAKWGEGQKAWRSRGWGRGSLGLEIPEEGQLGEGREEHSGRKSPVWGSLHMLVGDQWGGGCLHTWPPCQDAGPGAGDTTPQPLGAQPGRPLTLQSW